jgi:hypothetical protein
MITPWEVWFDAYIKLALEFWYLPYRIIGYSS